MKTPPAPPGRAAELVRTLGLVPHPEGGHYREVHRAAATVAPEDGRGPRTALTTIYFLLMGGEHSALHRVASDEIWHHYEGAALDLTCVEEGFAQVETKRLGPVGTDAAPVQAVPAGMWQAARSLGAYTLVGCTVAPGFSFEDFALLRDDTGLAAEITARLPELTALL